MSIKPPPQETNWLATSPGREIAFGFLALMSITAFSSLLSGVDLVMGMLSGITALIAVVVVVAIYMFPSIIARVCNHRNLLAIIVLNLLFGWTIIGWAILLGYALLVQERTR